jgi:pyrimidine operon attenuation protein / uracil phosphoribosyltransferase
MIILQQNEIALKIKRLAVEILEQNFSAPSLLLLGINNNGMAFAKLLAAELQERGNLNVHLGNIRLAPANPLQKPITCDIPDDELKKHSIIIVDDVANTGRTLFYALQPLMGIIPSKIEIAVLIERKHKQFPVQPDYVGMSLASTLLQNIEVSISEEEAWNVTLA